MKSNHKTQADKAEFEKLLEAAEKKPVPVRQCNIEDNTCESCSG